MRRCKNASPRPIPHEAPKPVSAGMVHPIKAGLLTLTLVVYTTIRCSALPCKTQWLTFVNEQRIRAYSGGTVRLGNKALRVPC